MICYFCKEEIPDLANSCLVCRTTSPDLVTVTTYDNRAIVRFRLKDKEWQWILYFHQYKSVLYSPALLKNVLKIPQLLPINLKNIAEKTQLYLTFL